MHFHVVTIHEELMRSYLEGSILGRARGAGKIKVSFYNPRDFVKDKHKTVDDRPYGGGPGMVMMAEPVIKAVQKAKGRKKGVKIILFSPRGKQFDTSYASKLAKEAKHIILICGHYEGIDARVKEVFNVEEVSIGPYVLTGGELPALAVIDAVSRFIPGVLGTDESNEALRIASPDVYTRPESFKYKGKEYTVPEVLTSGNHAEIEKWRSKKKKFI